MTSTSVGPPHLSCNRTARRAKETIDYPHHTMSNCASRVATCPGSVERRTGGTRGLGYDPDFGDEPPFAVAKRTERHDGMPWAVDVAVGHIQRLSCRRMTSDVRAVPPSQPTLSPTRLRRHSYYPRI
jgi:hypothetical protein